MKDVFAKLGQDFLSSIIFLVLYLVTGNVVLATGVAIAGAVAQVIHARVTGRPLDVMTYASLALVIVLGAATLLDVVAAFPLERAAILSAINVLSYCARFSGSDRTRYA